MDDEHRCSLALCGPVCCCGGACMRRILDVFADRETDRDGGQPRERGGERKDVFGLLAGALRLASRAITTTTLPPILGKCSAPLALRPPSLSAPSPQTRWRLMHVPDSRG